MTQERITWIKKWAEGWKPLIPEYDSDLYYAGLPFSAAVDMILELCEANDAP